MCCMIWAPAPLTAPLLAAALSAATLLLAAALSAATLYRRPPYNCAAKSVLASPSGSAS